MLSVDEAIRERRSVRAYARGPVDRATVRSLLEAAVLAPTAVHEEPWAFVVIQDRKLLRRVSDRAKPLFVAEARRARLDHGGHALEKFTLPEFDIFYDAGTLIVICARVDGPFVAADCWLAAENLMLAAQARGLGTCVVGSALGALGLPEVKNELGIPSGYTAIAPIVVGVPARPAPPTSRKAPMILAWK